MPVWAVVPVKHFERAKSRLGASLDPAGRAELARQLFEHVLESLRKAHDLSGVLVVAGSAEAAERAEALGAVAVRDPDGVSGLGAVVDAGIEAARERGADRVLVLMSDLPLLEVSEVQALLAALGTSDVVVAADRSGAHTNALGLRLTRSFPTRFGTPDSFQQHCDVARSLGATVTILSPRGVAFDIDTPDDLRALRALTAPR